MATGSRLPKGFFFLSSTFQTHFVLLIKPSQAFVRPTGIQALPSSVYSIIISVAVIICIIYLINILNNCSDKRKAIATLLKKALMCWASECLDTELVKFSFKTADIIMLGIFFENLSNALIEEPWLATMFSINFAKDKLSVSILFTHIIVYDVTPLEII